MPARIPWNFSPAQSRYPQLWKGCIGAWIPLAGPSGLSLFDRSGKNNTGTLNMTAAAGWTVSADGYALTFAANPNRVDIPQIPGIAAAPPITVTAWANVTTKNSYGGIVMPDNGSGGLILSGGAGNPLTYLWAITVDEYDMASGLNMTAGLWYFCAVAVTSTAATVYLGSNGTLSSTTNTKTHSSATPNAYKLGSDRGVVGHDFIGSIDDVKIYDRVLTTSELSLLATRRGIAYELADDEDDWALMLAQGSAVSPWLHYRQMAG